MKENLNTRLANVQVQRDVTYKPQQPANTLYSLGWGRNAQLQGDQLTYEELVALHTLIGRIIDRICPTPNEIENEVEAENMERFVILNTTTFTLAEVSEKWSLAVGDYDFIDVSADELRILQGLIDDVRPNNQTI